MLNDTCLTSFKSPGFPQFHIVYLGCCKGQPWSAKKEIFSILYHMCLPSPCVRVLFCLLLRALWFVHSGSCTTPATSSTNRRMLRWWNVQASVSLQKVMGTSVHLCSPVFVSSRMFNGYYPKRSQKLKSFKSPIQIDSRKNSRLSKSHPLNNMYPPG